MPKAILEFSLPDEQEEFEVAQNGQKYLCILTELQNYLRDKSKYENRSSIKIDEIREKINQLTNEYEVNE